MAQLTDKVALITGAGTGIGSGITRAFAREGAQLVLALGVCRHTLRFWCAGRCIAETKAWPLSQTHKGSRDDWYWADNVDD